MEENITNNKDLLVNYYDKINTLILRTKQRVAHHINYEMVELYYEIGTTINELIEKHNLESSQNEKKKLLFRRIY